MMTKFGTRLVSLALFAGCASAIWPIPASYVHGNGTVWLSEDVWMNLDCPKNVSNPGPLSCYGILTTLRAV